MALYAVESLLIADSVVNKRFVKPSATFDGGVSSNKMVLLFFQQLEEFVGNQPQIIILVIGGHSNRFVINKNALNVYSAPLSAQILL